MSREMSKHQQKRFSHQAEQIRDAREQREYRAQKRARARLVESQDEETLRVEAAMFGGRIG